MDSNINKTIKELLQTIADKLALLFLVNCGILGTLVGIAMKLD